MSVPDFPIEEITYEQAIARFGHLYRQAKLPTEEVASATWFASEATCGALVRASARKARIKATITAPEWEGFGLGAQMLEFLLAAAIEEGYSILEVFTRQPGWYERKGFEVVRVTKYGVSVLRLALSP